MKSSLDNPQNCVISISDEILTSSIEIYFKSSIPFSIVFANELAISESSSVVVSSVAASFILSTLDLDVIFADLSDIVALCSEITSSFVIDVSSLTSANFVSFDEVVNE